MRSKFSLKERSFCLLHEIAAWNLKNQARELVQELSNQPMLTTSSLLLEQFIESFCEKYSEEQPRAPRRQSNGGQWIDAGGESNESNPQENNTIPYHTI